MVFQSRICLKLVFKVENGQLWGALEAFFELHRSATGREKGKLRFF